MYCADTTFLIDILKQNPDAAALAHKIEGEYLITTAINSFELLSGAYGELHRHPAAVDKAHELLEVFSVLPLTQEGIERAAQAMGELLRKGRPIEASDCLAIGISLSHGCKKIITRNKEHFARIPDIEVITY